MSIAAVLRERLFTGRAHASGGRRVENWFQGSTLWIFALETASSTFEVRYERVVVSWSNTMLLHRPNSTSSVVSLRTPTRGPEWDVAAATFLPLIV